MANAHQRGIERYNTQRGMTQGWLFVCFFCVLITPNLERLNVILGPTIHDRASQKQASRLKSNRFPNISSFKRLLDNPSLSKYRYTIKGSKTQADDQIFYRGGGMFFTARFTLSSLGKTFDVFCSNAALSFLAGVGDLFLDGTFKYSPDGYMQVYRICKLVEGSFCLPVITITMKRRRTKDYEAAFLFVSFTLMSFYPSIFSALLSICWMTSESFSMLNLFISIKKRPLLKPFAPSLFICILELRRVFSMRRMHFFVGFTLMDFALCSINAIRSWYL